MKDIVRYGGQAVIEGVMMRGPGIVVTCVRAPSGAIVTHREHTACRDGRRWARLPVLRGMAALYDSLVWGMRSLLFSAGAAEGEEETLTEKEAALAVGAAVLFAAGLFFALPTAAAALLPDAVSAAERNLAEGLLRLALFLGYLWGISRMKDIRRVFEYHGAEHKAIFCLEKGLPLTVDHVRAQSRLHPRCGTNFLMIVMLLSLFSFALLGWPPLYARVLLRLALIPVIAGLAYEWLRFAADSESALVRALNRPGLWLELLTTREPHDDQMEVAIAALRGAAGLTEAADAPAER